MLSKNEYQEMFKIKHKTKLPDLYHTKELYEENYNIVCDKYNALELTDDYIKKQTFKMFKDFSIFLYCNHEYINDIILNLEKNKNIQITEKNLFHILANRNFDETIFKFIWNIALKISKSIKYSMKYDNYLVDKKQINAKNPHYICTMDVFNCIDKKNNLYDYLEFTKNYNPIKKLVFKITKKIQ